MLVESSMKPLGSVAPDFTLPNTVTGESFALAETQAEVATVIMFICNHCPYVKHVNDQLVAVSNDYSGKRVQFIGISSNDAEEYPEDSPEKMKEYAKQLGYGFPYLYDETQAVAKQYGAVCTPDFFVYDSEMKLRYRGRLDASSPGNDQPNDGTELRAALDALIAGEEVSSDQKPSMGCNIKWKDQ